MTHYYMHDLLLQSQRISGTRKPITIVDPDKYQAFFPRLRDASGMDLEFKTFLAVGLSGGFRVTEELSLCPNACDLIRGTCRVKVLKKKKRIRGERKQLRVHAVYRDVKLHPIALILLRQYLKEHPRRGFERIFQFERNYVHIQMKKYFGPHASAHMMRHSHISWLLNVKAQEQMTTARIMEMSPRNVASYNHVNRVSRLAGIFDDDDLLEQEAEKCQSA